VRKTCGAAVAVGLVLAAGLALGTLGCTPAGAVELAGARLPVGARLPTGAVELAGAGLRMGGAALPALSTGTMVPSAVPPGQLSVAHARAVYNTFVTTDDVARAAGDESLELALVSEAQVPLTVSALEQSDYSGAPTPRYSYGTPALYVPRMTSFPLWFVAVTPRTPARGGPARTAIMVFSRPTAADPWQLSLSTLLEPGTALPTIAVDPSGHTTALATFDRGLLVSPNSVGAVQAALADNGPGAASARVVATGPYTTGLYQQITSARRRVTQQGLNYDSTLQGSAFPLYALGTSDGGALVLYSMIRGTTILRRADHRKVQIPQAFAPILYATGRLVIRSELDTGETYQYAAYVPPTQPPGKPSGLMRVIASDGGPTSASGT
jgi:hypothetical protein